MHLRWRSTRATLSQRARRRARGQAILEFALVAPLLFTLIFGLMEFALIESSVASFNFAAKDAARLGSLLGRTDNTVDTQMLSDIHLRVAGVAVAQTVQVEVYRSDVTGAPPSSVENLYTFDSSGNQLPPTLNWPATARSDTLSDADYLGVRITYIYTYLTGFISGANSRLQLTANSVQRIEPQDFQSHLGSPLHRMQRVSVTAVTLVTPVAAQSGVPVRQQVRSLGDFGGSTPDGRAPMGTDLWRPEPAHVALADGGGR